MIPKPMLTRSGLGVHDYLFWKPALLARDWDVFAEQLAQRDVCLPDADIIAHQVEQPDDRPQPPTWVVLYTLCYNVRSESDAWKALALVYGHLPIAPPHLRPALLMLAACWLTSHDLLVPLQRVVDAFLTGAHGVPLEAFHFQLLLQLIAYASSSDRVAPILRAILDRAGDLPLNHATFDVLLRRPCANPRLGLAVARKMHAQGFTPTLRHLTQLVLLYSQAGWQRRAGSVMRAVRQHMAETKVSGGLRRAGGVETHMLVRAESRFLASFHSAQDLHAYLRKMVTVDSGDAAAGAEGDTDDVNGTVTTDQPDSSSTETGPYDRLPAGNVSALVRTAPAWASSVVVASKDQSTSSEYLYTAYRQALKAHPSLVRDTHMHICTINGLLQRQDYVNAVEVWKRLREQRPSMTKEVLTIGIETLTLAGQPLKALDLLYDRTELLQKKEFPGDPRAIIDARVVSAFMMSLQNAGYTDVIFVLWERIGELFNVRPYVYTFSILLKTARFASKCNPSFRGALAEMGLGGFIGKDSTSEDLTRDDYFLEAEMTINREATKGSSGLWNGERAGQVALRVAHEVFFSNWPELKDIPSPAHALRPTGDFQGSFPMTTLLRTVLRRETVPPPAPATTPPASSAVPARPYAGIILDDLAFRAYIDVLASEAEIPQIPLALAWMRALGVRPSRDTLASALVYWAEVGMDAPLFEHFRAGGASQYERLKRWMVEWVGAAAMPTDRDVAGNIHRYKLFKELSRRPSFDPDG